MPTPDSPYDNAPQSRTPELEGYLFYVVTAIMAFWAGMSC